MNSEMLFKPKINLSDMHGDNIYSVVGACGKVLKEFGWKDSAQELYEKASLRKSYDDVFELLREYFEDIGDESY